MLYYNLHQLFLCILFVTHPNNGYNQCKINLFSQDTISLQYIKEMPSDKADQTEKADQERQKALRKRAKKLRTRMAAKWVVVFVNHVFITRKSLNITWGILLPVHYRTKKLLVTRLIVCLYYFAILVPCNNFLKFILPFTEDENMKVICPTYHHKDRNLSKSRGKERLNRYQLNSLCHSKTRYSSLSVNWF